MMPERHVVEKEWKITTKFEKAGKDKPRKSQKLVMEQNQAPELVMEQIKTKEPVIWDKEAKHMLRWLSGTLEVPPACGGIFRYSVQEFGVFPADDNQDNESIEQAASLYIYTLYTGLIAAKKVQKKLAAGEVPLAVAASGLSLILGDAKLELEFCASPIPSAVASLDCASWSISGGGPFQGKARPQ